MKLKKGDTVRVITGKDKGKEGVVGRVFPDENKIIVNGVNTAAKHQKARRANEQAGIIDKDMPIHASNVQVVCPSCDKPTRIGYRGEGRDKQRVCRKCGKTFQ
jgi:large subunit ribosomal protein L24